MVWYLLGLISTEAEEIDDLYAPGATIGFPHLLGLPLLELLCPHLDVRDGCDRPPHIISHAMEQC